MLERVAKAVAVALSLDPTDHLLDIGCGDAALSQALLPYAQHITGIDPDGELLKEAQPHPRLTIRQAKVQDAEQILEKQVDSTLVYNVCQYWESEADALKALSAIFKVLKPGGRLLLGGIINADQFARYEEELQSNLTINSRAPNIGRPWQPTIIQRLTKDCGFESLALPYCGESSIKLPYRFDWLCRKPF